VSNQFGYLRGGIERIINGLETICRNNGGIVRTGAQVSRIVLKNDKVSKVEYRKNGKLREIKTDKVISTLPIPVLLKVSENLPQDYRKSLGNIKYKSSLCATIALTDRISPFYWLNIMDLKGYPFVGVFEHGHLNTDLKYPSVMFVVKYLDSTNKFWLKNDQEIVDEFILNLEEIFECDLTKRLLWWRLHRAKYSTPLFSPNYGKFMPKCESPVEGLYIGGISRTYPRDRYMGTALKTGLEASEVALLKN
jgi:protoporphyrinogen oxidase